jgi:hypothetical protein
VACGDRQEIITTSNGRKKNSFKLEGFKGGKCFNMKFGSASDGSVDLLDAQELDIEGEGGIWWNNSGVAYNEQKHETFRYRTRVKCHLPRAP